MEELQVKNPFCEEIKLRIKKEKVESMDFTCSEVPTTSENLVSDLKQEIVLHLENVLKRVEFLEENSNRIDIKLEVKEEKEESMDFTYSEVHTTSENLMIDLKQEIVPHLENVLKRVEFLEKNRNLSGINLKIKAEKENLESNNFKFQEIGHVVREVVDEVELHEKNRYQQAQKTRRKNLNKTSKNKSSRGILASELEKLTSSVGGVKLGHRYSLNSPVAHRTRSKLYRKSKRLNRRN